MMISILVLEIDRVEGPMNFVSNLLKGVEAQYKKIVKLAYAVVVSTRKTIPYFQGHPIMVKTNCPICQVLKKPNLAGRMMS